VRSRGCSHKSRDNERGDAHQAWTISTQNRPRRHCDHEVTLATCLVDFGQPSGARTPAMIRACHLRPWPAMAKAGPLTARIDVCLGWLLCMAACPAQRPPPAARPGVPATASR